MDVDMDTPTHLQVEPTRRALLELAKWIPEIPDPYTTVLGLSSSWPRPDGYVRALDFDALPHGLDAVFEDTDERGPYGVKTAEGARDLLEDWKFTIADAIGSDRIGGSYLAWLIRHHDRIAAEFLDAESYFEEVLALHSVVRRLTGRDPDNLGPCPYCGARVVSEVRASGMGLPRCAACATEWDSQAMLRAARAVEARRRLVTQPGPAPVWVSRALTLALHPDLRRGTLDVWIHRGHVACRGAEINLADVNRRLGTAVEAPCPSL